MFYWKLYESKPNWNEKIPTIVRFMWIFGAYFREMWCWKNIVEGFFLQCSFSITVFFNLSISQWKEIGDVLRESSCGPHFSSAMTICFAFKDLLRTLSYRFFFALTHKNSIFESLMCCFFYFFQALLRGALSQQSAVILVCMAIDRYICLLHPTRYHRHSSKKVCIYYLYFQYCFM